MDEQRAQQIRVLVHQYFELASKHVDSSNPRLNESLIKAIKSYSLKKDESEIPGHENKPSKFGQFENSEFVVSMTDIRKSSDIINSDGGLVHMFLIFYVYAGIVAKIVDDHNGTSTEFLGDGVLNLFSTKEIGRDQALRNSMLSSWEILWVRENILNPFFASVGLPQINMGIGVDHGTTIVTRFGYRKDTDLKAFGSCVYNAAKLSKGFNEILVSQRSQQVWPTAEGGNLHFQSSWDSQAGEWVFKANQLNLIANTGNG